MLRGELSTNGVNNKICKKNLNKHKTIQTLL